MIKIRIMGRLLKQLQEECNNRVGNMKKNASFLIIFLFFSNVMFSQVNQYDKPASVKFVDTYVPMSHDEIILRAAVLAWKDKQRKDDFEKHSQIAYEYLRKKQINYFVRYALCALNTGYYNNLLYYNLGISYCILEQKSKGKKYLKKASKKGFAEANQALYALKKKEALSYSWIMF